MYAESKLIVLVRMTTADSAEFPETLSVVWYSLTLPAASIILIFSIFFSWLDAYTEFSLHIATISRIMNWRLWAPEDISQSSSSSFLSRAVLWLQIELCTRILIRFSHRVALVVGLLHAWDLVWTFLYIFLNLCFTILRVHLRSQKWLDVCCVAVVCCSSPHCLVQHENTNRKWRSDGLMMII